MKKSIVIILLLAVGVYVGWQNRVNLLVWGLPLVIKVSKPVGPNIPVEWPDGPATASQPPAERPREPQRPGEQPAQVPVHPRVRAYR